MPSTQSSMQVVNTLGKLSVGGRVSMLPSRGMNDSSWVAKLQGGWQQWQKILSEGFCLLDYNSFLTDEDPGLGQNV